MTLSRKDFFRQSIFSLGETLLKAGETVREMQGSLQYATAREEAAEVAPVTGKEMVARADNEHCLAKYGGCFSCLDRCEAQAISLVLREGIKIDEQLCTGCGACHNICPLAPQALALVPRTS